MSGHDAGRWHTGRHGFALTGALAERLRQFGYDIESPRTREAPGSGIVARRDLGDRVILVAVDGGGRFRIELSWVVDERSAAETIAGVAVRVSDTVTRMITIVGHVDEAERLMEIVAALGAFAAWAQPQDPGTPPPRSDRNY
jgi:hypothetical protein